MSTKLGRELRAIGASRREAAELVRVADKLRHAHLPGMSDAAQQRVAARLPEDAGNGILRRSLSVRWAAASAFALLAVIAVGGVLLWPRHPAQASSPEASQTAKHASPALEQKLQQQAEQLQTLQQQPTVDQQAVQQAKTDFQRDYQQYTDSHANDTSFKNQWSGYQTAWWWQAANSAVQAATSAGASPSSVPVQATPPHAPTITH